MRWLTCGLIGLLLLLHGGGTACASSSSAPCLKLTKTLPPCHASGTQVTRGCCCHLTTPSVPLKTTRSEPVKLMAPDATPHVVFSDNRGAVEVSPRTAKPRRLDRLLLCILRI